jgi:dynein heavy chain
LVFGGLDKRIRYNDAWIFSLEDKEWSQLQFEGPCPEPRAHLTATKFGSKVVFFGGYGGAGQVFNDLWVLSRRRRSSPEDSSSDSSSCAKEFKWENLTEQLQGAAPSPCFDHTAFIYPVTPNSDTFDKLLVMGGRDLSAMLHDSYVLDLASMTWQTEGAPLLPFEVCNNVCDDIESVPYHKVFSFGGKKGMMQYMNTVEVMDCGSQVWSTPPVEGGKAPCGR